ncbi:hypothetical protein IWX49DRAFT_103122 [Phyllosticta citricarpa]|uniref:Uncharacterized protein n=2 Tax=Phyllosticta TaxID=121621 RepID=A0ABR1MN22_9PEZI
MSFYCWAASRNLSIGRANGIGAWARHGAPGGWRRPWCVYQNTSNHHVGSVRTMSASKHARSALSTLLEPGVRGCSHAGRAGTSSPGKPRFARADRRRTRRGVVKFVLAARLLFWMVVSGKARLVLPLSLHSHPCEKFRVPFPGMSHWKGKIHCFCFGTQTGRVLRSASHGHRFLFESSSILLSLCPQQPPPTAMTYLGGYSISTRLAESRHSGDGRPRRVSEICSRRSADVDGAKPSL